MEAASRRILGFTLSEHHDAAAAYGALAMAITVRGEVITEIDVLSDPERLARLDLTTVLS